LPLGFAASLTIVFIQVLQIPGIFNDTEYIFYGDYYNVPLIYNILEIISNAMLGLTCMFFALTFDVIVKRTKYIFTIYFAILVVMVIFLPLISSKPLETARNIYNWGIITGLVIFVPYVLYIYTKWSPPEFKAVSSFFLFSFLLLIYSYILALRAHKSLDFFRLILSPLLLILGCCIIIIPLKVKPKVIKRALFYWVFFALLALPIILYIIINDVIFVFGHSLDHK